MHDGLTAFLGISWALHVSKTRRASSSTRTKRLEKKTVVICYECFTGPKNKRRKGPAI